MSVPGRFATWNAKGMFAHWDVSKKSRLVARMFDSLAPRGDGLSVLALQELPVPTKPRPIPIDPLPAGCHLTLASRVRGSRAGHEDLGLLSNRVPQHVFVLDIPGVKTATLVAVFDVGNGAPLVRVAVVHFSTTDAARDVASTFNALGPFTGAPLVVLGDFNIDAAALGRVLSSVPGDCIPLLRPGTEMMPTLVSGRGSVDNIVSTRHLVWEQTDVRSFSSVADEDKGAYSDHHCVYASGSLDVANKSPPPVPFELTIQDPIKPDGLVPLLPEAARIDIPRGCDGRRITRQVVYCVLLLLVCLLMCITLH